MLKGGSYGLSGNGLSGRLFGGNRFLRSCNSKEFKGAGNRLGGNRLSGVKLGGSWLSGIKLGGSLFGGNSCECKPMVPRLGTIGCGDCQGPCDQMALI